METTIFVVTTIVKRRVQARQPSGWVPPELKRALARAARQRRCSEAEVLRQAVAQFVEEAEAPPPRLPLFRSSGPSIAEHVDDALEGFGLR